MLKLGTVFSGIGAIEQALKRMNIDHEIEFACDNGDININIDYENELNKIRRMNSVREKREYVNNIYKVNSRRTNFVELSYKANYKVNDDNFFYDVKLLDGTDFKNKIDLFVGGSPCQSFSVIGSRGGFEDARGTLFYEYARLVKEIEPKVFIYENVYGVLTHDKGNTWKVMQNIFNKLGYYYKWQILNAKDFGIPQGRRRLYVVGFKDKNDYDKFEFPKPIVLKYTMQDFLIDNVKEGNLISKNSKLIITEKKGEAVEVYATSLHYCPIQTVPEGFGCIVGLVKGTNLPLEFKPEDKLLFAANKWLLAHEDNTELINEGAFAGIYGENYTL